MSQVQQYEMKDSGVEWIGRIPKHWTMTKTKYCCSKIGSGKTPKGGAEIYCDSGIMFLRSQNIYPEGLRLDNVSYISPEIDNEMSSTQVAADDILLNITGGSIGRSCLYPHGLPHANVNQHVCIIRVLPQVITPKLMWYMWMSDIGQKAIEVSQTGANREGMTFEQIGNTVLPIMDKNEQAAIVAYLDEKCATIDALIAEARATIEEYKKWKASVIFEAVTKGVNPNAEMKDSGVDIIGIMPKYWSLVRQRFLCKTTTGDHDTQDADPDGKYPFYVRSPNVERSNTYTFDGEGILMAGDGVRAGKVFHYATGKYAIHQRVYCFYAFNQILPRFYFYYMSSLFSTEIDKGSAKSTVASVRLPMLKDFDICLPPQGEQEAIVAYLDSKCAAIDGIIAEKEALIGELESYKKSLIFETVTGKRKVWG